MIEDPELRRLWTINHEAGHAVAMWLRTGKAPREIDAYHPERDRYGHTIPPSISHIMIPDELVGAEARDRIDALLDRQRKDVAIWSRAGAMAAGDDWETDPVCTSDREAFREACERLPGRELLAEYETREMVDSPRFKALHKALTAELDRKQGAIDRTMYEPEIRACLTGADTLPLGRHRDETPRSCLVVGDRGLREELAPVGSELLVKRPGARGRLA